MKRATAILLMFVLLAVALAAVPAGADNGRLTVTVNSEAPASYRVGDEIAYYLDFDLGDVSILNGDVCITYDPDRLEIVEHTGVINGLESMDAYSFQPIIFYSNSTLNTENPGLIQFNFSRAKGIGTLTGDHTMLCRFRFKVKDTGSTDIAYEIRTMCNRDQTYIYYRSELNPAFNPTVTARTMFAAYTVGDVDANGTVDQDDALILDRYVAGWKGYDEKIVNADAADLSGDGAIGNRDAIILDRYLAGWEGYDRFILPVEW